MSAQVLTISVIILSVLMNAAAQLLLSVSLKGLTFAAGSPPLQSALSVAMRPGVIFAIAMYSMSVLLWMYVLSKTDVSLAYPFLGLGFAFVALFAWMFLGEPLGPQKLAGIAVISIGIILLARS